MKKWLVLAVVMMSLMAMIPNWARAVTGGPDSMITSYQVEMNLNRDGARRSTLDVVEKITYQFTDLDVKHGPIRSFVKQYDGHSLSFQLKRVTNAQGEPLDYHWRGDDLYIGNADRYVHGLNTYVLTYSMRDVTKYYPDTGRDEFYWDVVGVGWKEPLNNVVVRLNIAPELEQARSGQLNCSYGVQGSTNRCPDLLDSHEKDKPIKATFSRLEIGEGVTFAVGFAQGTFKPYQKSIFDIVAEIWVNLQVYGFFIASGVVTFLAIRRRKLTGRQSEVEPVVTEFIPPDASVAVSAYIGGMYGLAKGSAPTAQLIDLAVRGYIRIYQTKDKSLWSPAEYDIEITKDITKLRQEESEILRDMFDGDVAIGQKIELKSLKDNISFAKRLRDNDTKLDTLIGNAYELRQLNVEHQQKYKRYAKLMLIFGILLLSPWFLIGALIVLGISYTKSLTDKGLALRRYLMGFRKYIELAEADQLRLLQSPDGADKLSADGGAFDQATYLVHLYERTLPYAVLFGLEKEWSKRLGEVYIDNQTTPDWYSGGATDFSASSFVGSISSLGGAVGATGYSSSGYSSSSGGSSGGGFSGGGGGGGGGGSW